MQSLGFLIAVIVYDNYEIALMAETVARLASSLLFHVKLFDFVSEGFRALRPPPFGLQLPIAQ
jgi:hypothetical protein